MKNKPEVNRYGGRGFILVVAGNVIGEIGNESVLLLIGLIMVFIGYIYLVLSSLYYATGKGYSWKWGLWGLLTIPGFIVLVLLPDKRKDDNGG